MELKKALLVLVFFLTVLISKNIFGLKFVVAVKAYEATSSAEQSIATDSGDFSTLTPTLTPTPPLDFCKDGPDDENDEDDDSCIDIDEDDDDDDDNDDNGGGDSGGGSGGSDDDGDDDDGDDDDSSGGVSSLAPTGGFADMLAGLLLAAGLSFMTLGAAYGKKKTRKS